MLLAQTTFPLSGHHCASHLYCLRRTTPKNKSPAFKILQYNQTVGVTDACTVCISCILELHRSTEAYWPHSASILGVVKDESDDERQKKKYLYFLYEYKSEIISLVTRSLFSTNSAPAPMTCIRPVFSTLNAESKLMFIPQKTPRKTE